MKKIAILISGRGSNMRAIVGSDKVHADFLILSNQAQAQGLQWAASKGLRTVAIDHQNYATRDDFDLELMSHIDQYNPDLIVLAGFMRILTAKFCEHYEGRLVNIHPSLLPAFTGLNTHQRAIDMGCKIAGCTVHFVTPELDHGPIIQQCVVDIDQEDTADTLAEKVLQREHDVLPCVVADFLDGHLRIEGNRVLNANNMIEPKYN